MGQPESSDSSSHGPTSGSIYRTRGCKAADEVGSRAAARAFTGEGNSMTPPLGLPRGPADRDGGLPESSARGQQTGRHSGSWDAGRGSAPIREPVMIFCHSYLPPIDT